MNLGVVLSSGDSFQKMKENGQDARFIKYYLKPYSKNFDKVYVFSYKNEKVKNLPKNIVLVPNKYNIHRFIYGFLMPIFNIKQTLDCSIFRTYHLLGTLPVIVTRLILGKSFVFNFGYDYAKFALVEKKYIQYIFLLFIRPLANLLASKIIVLTKKAYHWKPKSNTVYIPNGIDTSLFKPMKKPSGDKVIKILNVGRLEDQKNQTSLIKALKNMNAKLTIIGNGSLKNKLENLAKKVNVDLKIIGSIENSKMPKIYNDADIFALPSLIEGAPKVLLEAMSCGLPPVVTKIDIVEKIVEDDVNGIFCNEHENSLREKLFYLSKNKDLRTNISKNARKDMVDNFDIADILKKEIEVLKEVAS